MVQLDIFTRVDPNNAIHNGLPIHEVLAYSSLKYGLIGEDEPWAEFTMYQY